MTRSLSRQMTSGYPPYISSMPTLGFKYIFPKKANKEAIFPLNQKKCYFFFSARYAIASGIKVLGIGPHDVILLPSYNCGTEIDPILHLGIRPVFYKIGKNLLVDIDDLLKKITKDVKAILVTHFLGFPQRIDEIKKICVEKNLFLIEDCAHAFLSTNNGKYLGSCGDIGVFSLLKTLPVPNGGVLVINNKNIKHKHNPKKPSMFSTFFYTAEDLLQRKTSTNNHRETVIRIFKRSLYLFSRSIKFYVAVFRKLFNHKGLYLVRPDSSLFVENLSSWGMSSLSKNIISNTDFEKVKNIRRRNFKYLLNHFLENEQMILPFRELPPGVSPLFFPIIIESAEKKEALYKTLKSKGISTNPWWVRFHPDVPWDEFPDAVYLIQKLFGLPIHQNLTLRHLDRVIEEFEKAYQSL